jgi:hypothetical protein
MKIESLDVSKVIKLKLLSRPVSIFDLSTFSTIIVPTMDMMRTLGSEE